MRPDGAPRVHPVTPIFTDEGLYLFVEPTSPKGADLRERGWFALHSGVPDNQGTGGEASINGTAHAVGDPDVRTTVAAVASYAAADRYLLFELLVHVITETATHAGHLDATRELIDGRTWLVLT